MTSPPPPPFEVTRAESANHYSFGASSFEQTVTLSYRIRGTSYESDVPTLLYHLKRSDLTFTELQDAFECIDAECTKKKCWLEEKVFEFLYDHIYWSPNAPIQTPNDPYRSGWTNVCCAFPERWGFFFFTEYIENNILAKTIPHSVWTKWFQELDTHPHKDKLRERLIKEWTMEGDVSPTLCTLCQNKCSSRRLFRLVQWVKLSPEIRQSIWKMAIETYDNTPINSTKSYMQEVRQWSDASDGEGELEDEEEETKKEETKKEGEDKGEEPKKEKARKRKRECKETQRARKASLIVLRYPRYLEKLQFVLYRIPLRLLNCKGRIHMEGENV